MKAVVISTYFDPETRRNVSPPAEVDLPQARFDRLLKAKCIKPAPQAARAPSRPAPRTKNNIDENED